MAETELDQLLRLQRGLVSFSQLADTGVSRVQVRHQLTRGWRMVLPKVVATSPGGLDSTQRLVAALLYAGEGAVIGGATAAAWHGVTSAGAAGPVHVEVPHARKPADAGFVVIRRTRASDQHAWSRPPLVVVSRQRAVATAARECRLERDAIAVVLEAVQRRLVRLDDLRTELECGPRAGSGQLRRAIEAAEQGAWSAPEADLFELMRRSRVLPRAWLNPELVTAGGLRLPRPDAWFDDVALAVQVHSHRYHSDPDDWEATVMTDGLLVECGVVVIAVTPRAIARQPVRVLRRVERAYGQAASRPRPAVRAVPIASIA